MDTGDLLLLNRLEEGLPLVPNPYAEIASNLGVSEDEVLGRISALRREGIIRRIRARINQRSIGICANALVAWKISDEESDRAGVSLSAFPGVTHCYRRARVPGRWEYSIYTVHHGRTRKEVSKEVMRISEITGYSEYLILFSMEEYKRVPHTRPRDLEVDE
jgi:DNA-binding Lrp family transcriptional regulator